MTALAVVALAPKMDARMASRLRSRHGEMRRELVRTVRNHPLLTGLVVPAVLACTVGTAFASPSFFGKPKVTPVGLVVPFTAELKGTLTITGTGLDKTVAALAPGTTRVKVRFTKVGRRDFKAHKTIHMLEVAKLSDESTGTSTYVIRL
jgi:hypothetical protein